MCDLHEGQLIVADNQLDPNEQENWHAEIYSQSYAGWPGEKFRIIKR